MLRQIGLPLSQVLFIYPPSLICVSQWSARQSRENGETNRTFHYFKSFWSIPQVWYIFLDEVRSNQRKTHRCPGKQTRGPYENLLVQVGQFVHNEIYLQNHTKKITRIMKIATISTMLNGRDQMLACIFNALIKVHHFVRRIACNFVCTMNSSVWHERSHWCLCHNLIRLKMITRLKFSKHRPSCEEHEEYILASLGSLNSIHRYNLTKAGQYNRKLDRAVGKENRDGAKMDPLGNCSKVLTVLTPIRRILESQMYTSA